jgi:hypothetical protein
MCGLEELYTRHTLLLQYSNQEVYEGLNTWLGRQFILRFSKYDYIASNFRVKINDEFQRTRFKVIFRHSTGLTEENH